MEEDEEERHQHLRHHTRRRQVQLEEAALALELQEFYITTPLK